MSEAQLFRIKFQFLSGRQVIKIGTQVDVDNIFDGVTLGNKHSTELTFEYPGSGPISYHEELVEYIDATPL